MNERLREAAARPSDEAVALPFSAYTDPTVFESEMERAFRGDWVAVCAAAELPAAGDYVALTLGGEPVVVMRGRDGTLRALSNVCRHRGTVLLDEGRGNAKHIVCPYHAWAYTDDGAFRGAPHTGNVTIEPAAHALPRFAIEIFAGVVFVNVDGRAGSLAARLEGLAPHLERYALERYDTPSGGYATTVWNANWKLAFENGIESYHLFKVHPESLEPGSPTRGAYYVEGAAEWAVTGGLLTGDRSPYPGEPESIGERERSHYRLISIPPSFVAALTRDALVWIALHPEAPDRTRVASGGLLPAALAAYAGSDGSSGFLDQVLVEDRWICERGQRGMKARHTQGGRLVELERVVGDFHQYLASRLFGCESAPRHREPLPESADALAEGPPPVSRLRPLLAILTAAAIIAAVEMVAYSLRDAEATAIAEREAPAIFDAPAVAAHYAEAWRSQDGRFDLDALGQLYPERASLPFLDAFGADPVEWSFERGHELGRVEWVPGLRRYVLEPELPFTVLPVGEGRVLTVGRYRLLGEFEGLPPLRAPLRQTALWEPGPHGWRLAHEHLSLPLEALE